MNYWVSFISKGNPNSDKTAVRWPKSEKLFDYLDLGKEIHIPAEDEKSILAVLNDMLLARNETSVRSYMDTTALGAPDLFRPM